MPWCCLFLIKSDLRRPQRLRDLVFSWNSFWLDRSLGLELIKLDFEPFFFYSLRWGVRSIGQYLLCKFYKGSCCPGFSFSQSANMITFSSFPSISLYHLQNFTPKTSILFREIFSILFHFINSGEHTFHVCRKMIKLSMLSMQRDRSKFDTNETEIFVGKKKRIVHRKAEGFSSTWKT